MLFKKSEEVLIFQYFLIIFLSIGLVLAGTIGILYNFESKDYLSRLKLEEQVALKMKKEIIANNFEAIVSDLFYLSRQNELLDLFDNNTNEIREAISREYLEFSRFKNIYDQIRYLDEKGMEIIRVNHKKDQPVVVRNEELQFKGDRYYFKDTFCLKNNEIFVSPFDLNIENERIEQPLKPMIRFGITVSDKKGHKRGVLLLNYLGNHMLESIRKADELSMGNIMLLNSDGYWLCSQNSEDEWGFMIKDRKNKTFPARYPDAWKQITDIENIQIYNNKGLFTAATIYPLQEGLKSSSGAADAIGDSGSYLTAKKYYWKIISHVPMTTLKSGTRGLLIKLLIFVVSLFILSAVPSRFLARIMVKRKLQQLELFHSANFDKLTGIPNRSLFFERLDQALKQARRYNKKLALLFIDLDGFKMVNDTAGHDRGDQLLIEVAKKIQGCVRESDTIARFGGDEFTVILTNIKSVNTAGLVAKKIITILSTPFTIKGKKYHIGSSIGVSTFPESGQTIDRLLKNADRAMYKVKKEGKNHFQFAINDDALTGV